MFSDRLRCLFIGACRKGDASWGIFLWDSMLTDADKTSLSSPGSEAFYLAVEAGSIELVRKLLDRSLDKFGLLMSTRPHLADLTQAEAFSLAAYAGDVDMFHLLISYVSPSQKIGLLNAVGSLILYLALEQKHAPFFEALIAYCRAEPAASELLQHMVRHNDYASLLYTAKRSPADVFVKILFFPKVLAYAEERYHEYRILV